MTLPGARWSYHIPRSHDRIGARRRWCSLLNHVRLNLAQWRAALVSEVGGADDRGRPYLADRALEYGLAEVDHVDVVADPVDQRHVVLDEQDSHSALGDDPRQDLAESFGLDAVQA